MGLLLAAPAVRVHAQAQNQLYQRAIDLENAGRNREAVAAYRAVIATGLTAQGIAGLQRVFSNLGQDDSVLAPLDTALKQTPTDRMLRGVQLRVLHASDEREIDAAFAEFADKRIGALVVSNDPYYAQRYEQIAALTLRYKLPAVFEWRRFVTRGGLMSYGTDLDAALREFGGYVARVLGGAKPADLPVLQPRRFELVINGKTANVLGLSIPAALRLRADDVIQ